MQFKRLFNNISIVQNGKKLKYTCVLGNRSRILKNLENNNKDAMYKLPMIVIQRTGITKNDERLSNVNNEVKYKVYPKKLDYELYTPVPIDISYQVSIISKYQEHIDWAMSNFIPFFNKDIFVRCEHPKFKDIEFTNQVIMDNSIDEEHADELDSTQDDIITCTCNFTFKTYLFCGNRQSETTSYSIQKVSTFLSVDEETGNESEVSVITDTEYIGFIPTINTIKYGFYPIPLLCVYEPQIQYVDAMSDEKAIISTDPYGDGNFVSATTSAEYYPHVDRLCWHVDEGVIRWY